MMSRKETIFGSDIAISVLTGIAALNDEIGSFRTRNDAVERRLIRLEAFVAQLAAPQGATR